MQTRKDLYQAHRLMTQRVALALLHGRPGAAESPLRRTGVGTLCGVMVAALLAAGFGIAGLVLKGGARNLERPGVLIIEKETGATYAYSAQDRKLIPFLNYASARLAMPTPQMNRKSVSAKSLAKYSRGPITGIPGAPESLPDPSGIHRGPWSLCVRTTGPSGNPIVSLVGGREVGGAPLTDAQAIAVRDGTQGWLIWRNARMRISPKAVRGLTAEQPVQVDERWLNGLPQGPDFAAPPVPGWGTPAPGPDGPAPIGQLFHVPQVAGTPERWYVQLTDGLSSISTTQARLLLDDATGAPGAPGQPRLITPGAAASKPSQTNLHTHVLPEVPPAVVGYDPGRPLCAIYRDTTRLSTEARFTIGGALPAASPNPTMSGLDQVVLPGGGTFAGTLSGPGQPPQAFCLVTDQGMRYPAPTQDDIAKLGYSPRRAAPVPANLLQLLKEGPALASDAALRPVPAR